MLVVEEAIDTSHPSALQSFLGSATERFAKTSRGSAMRLSRTWWPQPARPGFTK
ncbi:hypothetical protein [Paracoccus mutanolyticus]|uniref:hypothetical protein n=1 Tax=Paracoccus mutanolyticus TaxID=1499308 RepID=UPI00167AC8F9|nr:hypothetical protein [Paracoccus mutanolyticus]